MKCNHVYEVTQQKVDIIFFYLFLLQCRYRHSTSIATLSGYSTNPERFHLNTA